MENSLLLARIIGPCIIVIGIGMLLNMKNYVRIMEDFCKNHGLIYFGGLITFLLGLAMVLYHNVWTANWRVILTIFGWLTLIKGASFIIFPQAIIKITEAYIRNFRKLAFPLIIMLALGVFLMFKGY